MNAITFAVHKKSGDHVKVMLVPSNRSEEARFGVLDLCIVAFFLATTAGLIWLLVG